MRENRDRRTPNTDTFSAVFLKYLLVITSAEQLRQRLTIVLLLYLEFLNSSKSQCTRVIANLQTQCNNEQLWKPGTFFQGFKVSPVIIAFFKIRLLK